MRRRLTITLIAVSALLAGSLAAPPSASADHDGGSPARSTPQLIDAAVGRGDISRARGDLFLAYALGDHRKLPAAYRSDAPWHGTVPLLQLRRRVRTMPEGPERTRIERELEAEALASCGGVVGGASTLDSTYFHIEYTAGTIGGGLTINDYGTSLDTAWATHVSTFGWAAPPLNTAKYLVVVGNLGAGLYGFVTSTGTAGDNPNTSWNEGDARYSCMALNRNYNGFPSPPQASLDATTAHEFNHSIQFGYGALNGSNVPDDNFIEGGATWMEDEVFDGSNDNYNYLWPAFNDSMGQYNQSPYPYWITFRGLTERYGTGVGGGGEQVMQDFWEETSKNTGNNLTAMQTAMANRGTTLAEAFHAHAVAAKFMKGCSGGYALPYCFEEGPGYVAKKGLPGVHATISSVGGGLSTSIEDNYTINWVAIPADAGTYELTLANTSSGGTLRGSAVCDTGTTLAISPFPSVVGGTQSSTLQGFNSAGCLSAVAVLTNETQVAPNPSSNTTKSYQLSTAPGTSTPSLSISDAQVVEGPAQTSTKATFTVSLSAASAETVTVDFATQPVTATEGVDYRGTSGTKTFSAGTTTQTIDVQVRGDNIVEPDEQFNVVLSNAVGATIADGTGVGTIINDDGGGEGPALSISDAQVFEGNSGTTIMTFTVTLSPSSTGPVSVRFTTVDGTAVAGSDYAQTRGKLSFSAGETEKTVSVSVSGDTTPEPDETFFVELSGASGATIADGQGVGTILNDD
ncbi:MAG: Calx-beta domain-containing protein [Actinomycetota bacterium]